MEKMVQSRIAFECPVFKVEHAIVQLDDGSTQERWYAVKAPAVGVVAIGEDGRFLLTREYRSASGSVVWRVPAGGTKDSDPDVEAAARRELREETGYDARQLIPLLEKRSPSGWIKQTSHFFLAKDLFEAPLDSGESEQIDLVWCTPREVRNLIDTEAVHGGIREALAMALQQLMP